MQSPAQAQAGYKALVCVFLYGGNDGMNMVVPTDITRHDLYKDVRGALALPRTSLIDFAGTDFGLHPACRRCRAPGPTASWHRCSTSVRCLRR